MFENDVVEDIVYLACAANGRRVVAALDAERAEHAKQVADLKHRISELEGQLQDERE